MPIRFPKNPPTEEWFHKRVTLHIAKRARRRAKPRIPSKALRKSLSMLELGPGRIDLHVPHYWARYLHDGRGPVRPVSAPTLLYFPNVRHDPRVGGGKNYPVTKADIVRFTHEEYKHHKAKGKMRSVKSVGPAAGKHFFSREMKGTMAGIQDGEIVRMMDRFMKRVTPSGEQIIHIKLM